MYFKKENIKEVGKLKFYSSESDFENEYIILRKVEGRVYPDSELLMLPNVEQNNVHFKEWNIRKKSADNFISYIRKKKSKL